MDAFVKGVSEYKDLAAFVVAIAALAVAVWTAHVQRIHNRLSVVPLPYISLRDMEDEIVVSLVNNGNGPMIVRSLEALRSDGKVFDQLINAMPQDISSWRFFAGLFQARSLKAGSAIPLVDRDFGRSPFEEDYRSRIRRTLGAIQIRLTYTDIYRTKFAVYEKKLEWFLRNQPPARARQL